MSNECMHSCIAPNMNRCIKCGKVWDNKAEAWVVPMRDGEDDATPPIAKPVAEWVKSAHGNYPELRWAKGHNVKIGDKLYSVPTPTVSIYDPAVAAHIHATSLEQITELAERIMKNTKANCFSASAGLIHSFAYEIAEAVKRMQA